MKAAAGDSVFVSYADGGFAAFGDQGTGTVPVTGPGTRLMWYPAKSAFRAGRVDGAQWDPTSVGIHSVAFGENTTASSGASMAIGFGTNVSGFTSAAMGFRTIAATDNSLSLGRYNAANTTADNTVLVVGNGSLGSCSDALVLDFGGNLAISGSLVENSHRRLKEDIAPMNAALDKLGAIEPVRFRFRDEQTHPSGTQVGLIAQEVRKAFPALVSEGASGQLSVSYSKFTAVLLKGLQEQQAQIDQLQKKANRVDALEERLSALEQERGGVLAAGGPWTVVFLGALVLGVVVLVPRCRRPVAR